MSRYKGKARLNVTYNVMDYAPLDTRQLVPTKADLTVQDNWTIEGELYAYNGMIVAVGSDPIEDNCGIYRLYDKNNLSEEDYPVVTDINNWCKIADKNQLDALNTLISEIKDRVQALEESGDSAIGIDSFDPFYFTLNDQQKITINNIVTPGPLAGMDNVDNPSIATVGVVVSIVEGRIEAAHRVTSTQRRYKVIVDGEPDFANPPSFDTMSDFGTATPNIVQGNWMWSATRLTYENGGTITSYALSYVGKDGIQGENGITPHIGDNGNWFIGDEDTGRPAQGPAGPNFITQVGNKEISDEFLAGNNTLNIFAPQSKTLFAADTSTAIAKTAKLNSTMYVSIFDDANANKFVYAPLVIDDGELQ